jgi:O-antigen/teichoic acid export membrane protein
MAQFRDRVVSGLGWSGFSQLIRETLRLGIGILLARLLTPEEFGLVGMIYVFTGFATLFGDLGLGAAIIHRRDLEEAHMTAAFWANVVAGCLLTVLFIAGSPLIAAFYDEPALRPLTRVVAFQFVISSLKVVQLARFNRDMEFRTLALIETGSAAVAGGLGIAMALMGFGVWSLVAHSLAGSAITTAWMWITSPWKPGVHFRRRKLEDLLGFSSNLLGYEIFNYWIRNADNLLIGRVVGSAALGIYSRAYALLLMPSAQITRVVGRVMFPALSSIQSDTARVRDVYLRTLQAIAFLTFPMMVGLFVVADDFVFALLGVQWAAVIPVLRLFALLGLTQSVKATVGWIYQSQGRTDIMFRWGLAAGGVYLVSYAIGIQWGMIGVAVAYTIASGLILTYPNFAIPGRLIDLTFSRIAAALFSTLLCALAMGVLVGGLALVLPDAWPPGLSLLLQSAVGAVAYAALVHLFDIPGYREMRRLVRRRGPKP